jgi:cysteine synthase
MHPSPREASGARVVFMHLLLQPFRHIDVKTAVGENDTVRIVLRSAIDPAGTVFRNAGPKAEEHGTIALLPRPRTTGRTTLSDSNKTLQLDSPGRGRIYDSILETIGNTPLVRLGRMAEEAGCQAEILAKLEFFNPISSVKDRIAVSMIEAMEADGTIGPGSVIVEPTSGNTGIGLAFVCAAKGYRCILCMPDSFSIERRKLMKLFGAELALTPKAEGIKGAIKRAEEIIAETPGAVMPWQFGHPANPEIHRRTTAEEIWRDTDGKVDAVIMGVGTGGTLTGVGEVLKARKPDVRIVAIEPEASQVLSGGTHSPHMIQGIGAGFVPEILNTDLIDEIMLAGNDQAMETARKAAVMEGIPAGISSGAALACAIRYAQRDEMKGKTIVTVLPSCAERYLSTALFEPFGDG